MRLRDVERFDEKKVLVEISKSCLVVFTMSLPSPCRDRRLRLQGTRGHRRGTTFRISMC